MSDDVWFSTQTTPAAVESALREMLAHRHRRSAAFAPARVLNLVAVVDAEFSGEVENRLERLRDTHPSRLILCKVAEGQEGLDAVASIGSEHDDPAAGEVAIGREKVELRMPPRLVSSLDSIVGPLMVGDLPTVVWAPHGHEEGVDSLRRHAQVVLIDSHDEPSVARAMTRAQSLSAHMQVVDLSWLRSAPWRERIAAAFDPPELRRALLSISEVTVRHREDSASGALLFCGWLATRLGWRPSSLTYRGGDLCGRLRARRGEVAVTLEAVELPTPGLCGVTVTMASGESVSLDRAPGGLASLRRGRDGREQRWMALGASRGEAGILGDGVRLALVRDRIYQPALSAATAMAA